MRIGIDVGGTNTDAVLLDGSNVLAATKQPTSEDVSSGVTAAIAALLSLADTTPSTIDSVMIGTTHFTNALVERRRLDRVGILRLASPSGEALPPLTGWPDALARQIGEAVHLLPGGYEFDGREISPFDEDRVRGAVQDCRTRGIDSIAISSAFAPLNPAMEVRAAEIIAQEHPAARISQSHAIGSLGLVERENGTILNAALATLARDAIGSFRRAVGEAGLRVTLYISQNDGTLISADEAERYPVLTIGSGPTNSMRGAAFLTGLDDAIVMDVGGTTTDIGVLANGFPRESSVAVDIGGARTNFRMPDILAIGLGGGTRIHLDPQQFGSDSPPITDTAIGPDSTGFRIAQESYLFGGNTLTASDVAVACGCARFGDPARLPALSQSVQAGLWLRFQAMLEEGIDRMKTARGAATAIAVGGGHFLVGDELAGIARVVRPRHAEVANAIGAAIAQVGAQLDVVVDYDSEPRETAMARLQEMATSRIVDAGGMAGAVRIIEADEVSLSYLPGRATRVRIKAVSDLAGSSRPAELTGARHAY